MSIIAVHSFLDDLITTLCKMYDFESKEWNILDEVEIINNKFKENNKDINTVCNEKLELEKLIGKDKYHKSEEYIKLFDIKYHISVHKNSNSNEIFDKLLKDNILEFLEPFIVYAEKLNDCSEYHKRIRKEVMDNFIKRLEEEEVKNGK